MKDFDPIDPFPIFDFMKVRPSWNLPPPGSKYEIELDALIETTKEEVNLRSAMDAQVWTKEFMKVFKDLYKIDIDEEWIHRWFANAIMCGYDHMSWKRDKEYIYILQSNSGAIVKVFHWEPSIQDN